MADIVVITGLSGAGRSGVADVLEDIGWYVVDNLPTSLVEKIVELAALPGAGGVPGGPASIVWRWSPAGTTARCSSASRRCGRAVTRVTLLFLDASTAELVRRYDATRRKHPLAERAGGVLESIELERELLAPVRDAADLVIDTTELNVHQLKARVVAAFAEAGSTQMQVAVESFGFKHGLPLDADIVMDVRFLPNPHWDEALRPLTGHDPAVRDYVIERKADIRLPRRVRRAVAHGAARLPVRGTQLPDDRDRLHRRASPHRWRSPRSWPTACVPAASPCARPSRHRPLTRVGSGRSSQPRPSATLGRV